MDLVFDFLLGCCCAMLLAWILFFTPNHNTKLIGCSGVTQCEVHGEFSNKYSCEQMKVKLENGNNILEFICEEK